MSKKYEQPLATLIPLPELCQPNPTSQPESGGEVGGESGGFESNRRDHSIWDEEI